MIKWIVTTALMTLASITIFPGCGGNETSDVTDALTTDTSTAEAPATGAVADEGKSPDWLEIESIVDEAIVCLSYRDKSVLYDNELPYLTDEETFDDYLKRGEVAWANADSLEYVEVADIIFYGRDSALVNSVFHFKGASGREWASDSQLRAYFRDGHWLVPYVSRIEHQLAYDDLIRQADDDAW